MSNEDRPGEKASEIISQDVDSRLDTLEAEQARVRETIAELDVPIYKKSTFLGAAVGVVFVAISWFASHLWQDPEIPRIVHSNILMSDKALALMLKRGRDTPLSEEISNIATAQSVRTFSGSRTYKRHVIPIGSVRCQMMADPQLWELVHESDAQSALNEEFEKSCSSPDGPAAQIVVPFVDFTPLIIPFTASQGDLVELDIRILADRYDPDGTKVEIPDAHKYVEAMLFPETLIDFPSPVRKNHIERKFEIPDGRSSQIVAINLNPEGQQKVFSINETSAASEHEFRINLFATITVVPKRAN